MIGAVENYSALVKPAAISKHLKVVKVHCKEVDEGVCETVKFLSTLDVVVLIRRMDRSTNRKITVGPLHYFNISEISIFFSL